MKIALIIPSTSNGRDWLKFEETYLFKHTLKTFLITYNQEHHYKFFIGIDRGDKIYDNNEIKAKIHRVISIMKNVELEFIYMDGINKGHLTVMWNRLFDRALDEDYDYFFQCGDDIEFLTKNWVNDCIDVLKTTSGVGLVGPINNNPRILTQSFVSRRHKELFGYFFPPEIINWCCDDWINDVYKELKHFYPLSKHFCSNVGGQPRYTIDNNKNFTNNMRGNMVKMRNKTMEIVKRDVSKLVNNSTITTNSGKIEFN